MPDDKQPDINATQSAGQGADRTTQIGQTDATHIYQITFPETTADPEAVAEAMARIEPILEAQRQQRAKAAKSRDRSRKRVVNTPLTTPDHFKNRVQEIADLSKHIADPAVQLVTIVGRGGMGKTALAAKVLDALEKNRLAEVEDAPKLDGLIYLSARTTGITLDRIFTDVGKMLGEPAQSDLDAMWRDQGRPLPDKIQALYGHLSEGLYVILLDNLEDLLDDDSGHIADEDLRAFVDLGLQLPSGAQLIVTSRELLRIPAAGKRAARKLEMRDGLPEPDAIEMLRELDPDNEAGLQKADKSLLKRAVKLTQGVPRALELLAAILSDPASPVMLADLLADKALFFAHEDVTKALAQEAYRRLNEDARRVMEALAVFKEPVPGVAVEYLLAPWTPDLDVAAALRALVTHHHVTLNRLSGEYGLHPIDRDCVYHLLPADEMPDDNVVRVTGGSPLRGDDADEPGDAEYTHRNLERRAADYYAEQRLPQSEWKTIDDLAPQLAEFEHRLSAGDYDTACRLLNDIDFDYLQLWGHSRRVVPMRKRLIGGLNSDHLQMMNLIYLGLHGNNLGRVRNAIKYYDQALAFTREMGDKHNEGTCLGNLGIAYSDLGEVRRAIDFYQQALDISREIGDRRMEGNVLGNLGNAYSALGEVRRAINFYEQALDISREIGDRRGEGADLGNLGSAYHTLGDGRRAIDFYERALEIAREIGDRRREGRHLGNLGTAYYYLGDTQRATECYEKAMVIAQETKDIALESMLIFCAAIDAFSEERDTEAKDLTEFIEQTGDDTELALSQMAALLMNANLLAEQGELERSNILAGKLHELAQHTQNPYFELMAQITLSYNSQDSNDLEQALYHMQTSRQVAVQIEVNPELVNTLEQRFHYLNELINSKGNE